MVVIDTTTGRIYETDGSRLGVLETPRRQFEQYRLRDKETGNIRFVHKDIREVYRYAVLRGWAWKDPATSRVHVNAGFLIEKHAADLG